MLLPSIEKRSNARSNQGIINYTEIGKMSNTAPETHRCGVLKVNFIDAKLVKWYDDFQKDYKKFISLFFSWSGMGYTRIDKDGSPIRDKDGNYCYVLPEQAVESRGNQFKNKELVSKADQFISTMIEGDGSHYSLFYPKYKPNGATKKATQETFLIALKNDNKNIQEECIKKDPRLNMPEQFWQEPTRLLKEGKTTKEVWATVGKAIAEPSGELGVYLRKNLGLTCARPDDNPYCLILLEMLRSQIRSLKGKYDLHIEEYETLKKQVESYENEPMFILMKDLAKDLEASNYGLTKAVIGQAVKDIKNNKIEQSIYLTAIEILTKEKYLPIVSMADKERFSLYNKFKKYRQFKNRRKYPIRPSICDPESNLAANDVKIIFQVNQKGRFRWEKQGEKLKVSIGEAGSLNCFKSCYMADLDFNLSADGKQYDIVFRHESRIDKRLAEKRVNKVNPTPIKPPSDWIRGAVKSIGLQKKDNKFYMTIPYDINFPEQRQKIAQLFINAECLPKEKLQELPKKFIASGVDLNLGNPIAVSTAEFYYQGDGPVQQNGSISALDYGYGNLVKKPFFGAVDGKQVRKLISIRNMCSDLKRAIREYKAMLKKYMYGESEEFKISDVTMNWLKTAKISKKTQERLNSQPNEYNQFVAEEKLERISERLGEQRKPVRVPLIDNIRPYIEAKIKKIRTALKKCHKTERDTGYKDISHMIRLFEASDNYHSLVQAYQRIHLLPGEMINRRKSINQKRCNWRLFVSRKIAAHVVNSTKGSDVVFLEDLTSNYDADNDNNSLARLFSGPTLVKIIKQSLNKAGIAVVFVDPAGTSKTDPLTGKIGKRFKNRKNDLIVNRDGVDVRIDSDLAASMNIMLKGLSHNVAKYSFWSGGEEDRETAKRLTRFFRVKFETKNPKFIKTNEIVEVTTKAKKNEIIPNQKLYYRSNRIITVVEHHQEQRDIERRCGDLTKLPKVDVTPDTTVIYENFRI